MNMRKPSAALFLFILIIVSCAVNPVTGKKELMLVSEQDEIALGQQTDEEITQMYGTYEDPALSEFVNRLGQNMSQITHRPNLKYQFKVLDTEVINAFAVPGGYIYLTRGILAYLNDEAELAGVVGHELGHVNARHSAQQMSRMQLAQLGLGVGMILSEKFRKYADLAQLGVGLLFLKYSRDNERQADDLGVEYGSKSGFDTYRMAAFFETLERLSPSEGGGLPDWFSTHPNPVNRIQAVKNKTAEWRQKLERTQYAVNRDDYLKTVGGIIFGQDPRQGYVEDNVFYHPTLRFSFPIPSGWKINNTPAEVQLVSEKEDAVIILTVDNSPSASEAADKFVQKNNVSMESREPLRVNGLQAQKVVARLVSESDTLETMSYFIAKEGAVYALHGMTGQNGYSEYGPTFSRTLSGFKTLNDPSKINVKPQKLAVRTVSRPGTLKAVLTRWGTPESELESLAVMNGMQLADNLSAGALVKTIVK